MRTLKQFLFLALMLCTGFACAQQTQNNSGFITSTQCVLVPAGGLNTGGYGVTGTWTGTLTAYGVVGQGSATSLGSATTNGSYTVSIAGYTLFEVCGNTVGSGAAFVQVTASSAGGGSSSGGCIATVSSLSSSCGTKPGTLASVTDGSTTSDCTVGGGSNKNACIYNGSAWAFAGNSGSNPTYAQVGTGTNTSSTFTTGSGGTLNVASGAVIDFSLIGTGTFKIPASAGCTTSATKNICLDSSTGLLHVYQSAADAVFNTGAFAAAYSLPAATASTLGGVKPDGATLTNSSGAIAVNYTSATYFPFQSLTITGTNCASASLSGGVLNIPACTGSGTLAFPVTVSGTTTQYHFPYFATSTSLANDSNLDDGGTTANTLTYGGSGGITASAGPVTAAAPSGKAGMFALAGNTANQTLPTNYFAWGGFSITSATAYGLQPPNAPPSGTQVMSCPTPTSGWSQCSWATLSGSGTVNNAAQYDVPYYSASGTNNTLSGAAISGFQYDSTSGAPQAATSANLGTLLNIAQYDILLSGGTSAAPVGLAPSSTSGLPLLSQGASANPAYGQVAGAGMVNNTVTATQLATQYSKGSCTEVWGGTNTGNALQSGDDAISNNTCYNDSGVTRTITAVKCRSDNASNTTTVNPTFGSAGTGTTILSGALTCGSSYAYSSSGTVSNASWTTGSGIDPAMGGTLTGTSIAVIVEYTF